MTLGRQLTSQKHSLGGSSKHLYRGGCGQLLFCISPDDRRYYKTSNDCRIEIYAPRGLSTYAYVGSLFFGTCYVSLSLFFSPSSALRLLTTSRRKAPSIELHNGLAPSYSPTQPLGPSSTPLTPSPGEGNLLKQATPKSFSFVTSPHMSPPAACTKFEGRDAQSHLSCALVPTFLASCHSRSLSDVTCVAHRPRQGRK
jgi:hypothetical protein